MLKKTAQKAMWLAKGAAIFWGAVMTLALVLGAGTVALAAVPGDPFRLGQTNSIQNAFTKIAGSNPGDAVLKVDNNSAAGGSRALDLRVEAGKQPINVNAEAGKAANLNADELDGLGAAEIGINGLEKVTGDSDFDSVSNKLVVAECPAGKVLVGTAYDTFGATSGAPPNQLSDIAVNAMLPSQTADGRDRVVGVAREEEPTSANWELRVFAFCATEGTP